MKKIFFNLLIVFLLVGVFTSCAREEFMDLSGFTERFSFGEEKLDTEDFYFKKDENSNSIYYTFFENKKSCVMLKLIADTDNKIGEIRIYLPKYDENAKEKQITADDISLFINVTENALSAFSGFNDETAETITREMCLYEKKSYSDKGELTKKKDNFYFVYLSASLGSEFIIYNTYLKEIEKTEKPESKPVYGDTTNIRADRKTLE